MTKFDTKYQVYYLVKSDGKTKVTFVVTQKNNFSIVYATEYGISLNQTKIDNLKITDDGQPVTNPTIVNSQNQTIISFPFAKKVAGKDKVRTFSIEYETDEIVNHQGNTWQINIPRFESDETISEQTAILSLPEDFPKPGYVDPKPDIVNNNTYYFSSKIMANKPISLIFGDSQYYQLSVSYVLENNQSATTKKSITLIPDTAYQTVNYQSIDPKPLSVTEDNDGNLLAWYDLKPNETVEILTSLLVKTSFVPYQFNQSTGSNYLEKNDIWNFDSPSFTSPEIKNLTTPKSIYDYVTNKLSYDYQKIDLTGTIRQPASEVLKNPLSAICTDFTDLFISLSRRAGIPSRELEGIALSDNQNLKPISSKLDLLHAWPEYFDNDKKVWIQVDPTWANTTRGQDYFNKLDFNHIVFAIHGTTPLEPVPAGGFKGSKKDTKQVIAQINPKVDFQISKPSLELSSKNINQAQLTITNEGGTYIYGQLKVSEDKYLHPFESQISIPPYGKKEILLKTKMFSMFDPDNDKSIIFINEEKYDIKTKQHQSYSPFVLAAGSIFLGFVTLTARSLLFRRRKQKTHIHR